MLQNNSQKIQYGVSSMKQWSQQLRVGQLENVIYELPNTKRPLVWYYANLNSLEQNVETIKKNTETETHW
jgi:hypothetical protein